MTPASQETIHWSPAKRVGFRFIFVYFLLYSFPFPINFFTEIFAAKYELWKRITPHFAEIFLGIENLNIGPNGSGDTTGDIVNNFMFLVISLLATLIWSFFDRRRRHYQSLAKFFIIGVRYYLGCFMLLYGSWKVFMLQFGEPSFERLLMTYGDSSPMRLVWTFMGSSEAYNVWTGGAEVIAGLLLFFRRTRLLGAAFTIAVMSNVVMLNMCFDVCVKFFSLNLTFFAIGLLLLDYKRLMSFLIYHQPLEAQAFPPHFSNPKWNKAAKVVKATFLIAFFAVIGKQTVDNLNLYGPNIPKPELYGLYDVTSFTLDGEERPPLLTDLDRWQNLCVDWGFYGTVRRMDGSFERIIWEIDSEKQTIKLPDSNEKEKKNEWAYTYEENILQLKGNRDSKDYEITLKRREKGKQDFLLLNRGFHWVNESPYNRYEDRRKRKQE